jgi:hypothetical protein
MILGVEKAKITPQSPKTEFRAHNLFGICISEKIYSFGGQKGKNKPSEPKISILV